MCSVFLLIQYWMASLFQLFITRLLDIKKTYKKINKKKERKKERKSVHKGLYGLCSSITYKDDPRFIQPESRGGDSLGYHIIHA